MRYNYSYNYKKNMKKLILKLRLVHDYKKNYVLQFKTVGWFARWITVTTLYTYHIAFIQTR